MAINCSLHFFLSNKTGICSPICGEWEEFSHGTVVTFKIFTSFMYLIHLSGAAIALSLSCYNYKIMWVYCLNIHAHYYRVSVNFMNATHGQRTVDWHTIIKSLNIQHDSNMSHIYFDQTCPSSGLLHLTPLYFRFTFPSILLVYYLVSPIILDVAFFVGLAGQNTLLCSSSNVLEAIEHSTQFCYFSGEP